MKLKLFLGFILMSGLALLLLYKAREKGMTDRSFTRKERPPGFPSVPAEETPREATKRFIRPTSHVQENRWAITPPKEGAVINKTPPPELPKMEISSRIPTELREKLVTNHQRREREWAKVLEELKKQEELDKKMTKENDRVRQGGGEEARKTALERDLNERKKACETVLLKIKNDYQEKLKTGLETSSKMSYKGTLLLQESEIKVFLEKAKANLPGLK